MVHEKNRTGCAISNSRFLFFSGKDPLQNSEEISEKALEAGSNEDFAKAFELISSIDQRDSLYCSSLVPKSYYLLKLERFDDAIKVADTGLGMECGENALFFMSIKE